MNMCAINPKRQGRLTVSVYTCMEMTEKEFEQLVAEKIAAAEIELNKDMRLRWHVTDNK